MKKLLSLVLVTFMAMSMFVITAQAETCYPLASSYFEVVGDWDFDEATAADTLTIVEQTDDGTVSFANGGITFTEQEGGKFPSYTFAENQTANPTVSDWVYYEYTADFRGAKGIDGTRFYVQGISGTSYKNLAYIGINDKDISFAYVNGTDYKGYVIDAIDVPDMYTAERTKFGYLINLSEKRYIGIVNDVVACDITLADDINNRTLPMRGATYVQPSYAVPAEATYTLYDYKMCTVKKPYTYESKASLTSISPSGTAGTFTTDTTDGFKVTMTSEAGLPSFEIPKLLNTTGAVNTSAFCQKLVINTGGLGTNGYYLKYRSASSASNAGGLAGVTAYRDKIILHRAGYSDTYTYTIPASKIGQDIEVAAVFEKDLGNVYWYIDKEHQVTFALGGTRKGWGQMYGATTQVSALTDNTNAVAGDYFIVKEYSLYSSLDGSELLIPENNGALTANVSYNADSVATAGDTIQATVSLNQSGNNFWGSASTVIIASYAENGSLYDFEKVDAAKVQGGSSTTVTKTVDVTANGQVRVFLWDDMKTLVPVETFSPLQ